MKKILTAILLAAVLVGGTFLVTQNALAQEEPVGLIERLAQRFGLDQAQVEEEVSRFRQDGGSRHGGPIKGDLDQAVTDGAISPEQKQALEAKWEERQAQREAHREEMKTWMEEQGLDCQTLSQYRGAMRGGRKGLTE